MTDDQVTALRARIGRYLAWQDDPQWEPCPRCQGKGYHHGFGEHGADPDWCLDCGGPGQRPTEPGMWSPDDLLREVLEVLLVAPAQETGYRRHNPKNCPSGFIGCQNCDSSIPPPPEAP